MRIGTIINNHWASKENPTKYFIYMGTQGKYATGIYLNSDGKLKKSRHYARDVKDGEAFEAVGYCDAFEVMKRDLRATATLDFIENNKNRYDYNSYY